MANMSYCRFENTLDDLQDCFEHFDDRDDDGEPVRLSSEREARARRRLLDLVCEFAAEFGGMEYSEGED